MITIFAPATPEVKSLDFNMFRGQLKITKKARLIDVSTKEEHQELRIPGSLNMDVISQHFTSAIDSMDRTKAYFIYCRNGKRSETACRLMAEMGFRKIFNLASGITSWKGTLERSF